MFFFVLGWLDAVRFPLCARSFPYRRPPEALVIVDGALSGVVFFLASAGVAERRHADGNWLTRRRAGFYWVLLSFNGDIGGFTLYYRVLLGFTEFHWIHCVILGFTSFYRIWLDSYRVLPGFTLIHRVLSGFTGFYWVLLGFTEFLRWYRRFYSDYIANNGENAVQSHRVVRRMNGNRFLLLLDSFSKHFRWPRWRRIFRTVFCWKCRAGLGVFLFFVFYFCPPVCVRFFFVFQPIGLFQLFRGSFIGSTSAAARQLARFSRRPYMSFFCDITGFFYRVFRSQHPRSQFGIFWAKPSSWRGNSLSEFYFILI